MTILNKRLYSFINV